MKLQADLQALEDQGGSQRNVEVVIHMHLPLPVTSDLVFVVDDNDSE